MLYTRRDFGKLALAAGAASPLLAAKPNSNYNGVQIGAITYSFRALPGSADEVLQYCVQCGISAIELMSNVPESYAGSPAPAGRGGAGGAGRGRGPGGGRAPMTPEQQAAMQKAAEEAQGLAPFRLDEQVQGVPQDV